MRGGGRRRGAWHGGEVRGRSGGSSVGAQDGLLRRRRWEVEGRRVRTRGGRKGSGDIQGKGGRCGGFERVGRRQWRRMLGKGEGQVGGVGGEGGERGRGLVSRERLFVTELGEAVLPAVAEGDVGLGRASGSHNCRSHCHGDSPAWKRSSWRGGRHLRRDPNGGRRTKGSETAPALPRLEVAGSRWMAEGGDRHLSVCRGHAGEAGEAIRCVERARGVPT